MAPKHLAPSLFLLVVVTAGTYYYYLSCYYYSPSSQEQRLLLSPIPTIVAFQDIDAPPVCEPVPHIDDTSQEWHRVDNNSQWYVYSAYVDNRPSIPLVRVVAMAKGYSDLPLFCRCWHDTGSSPSVRARKQEMWIRAWDSAEPNRYYHPYLLSCPMPPSGDPIAVSIVAKPCDKPTHRIPLDHSSSKNSTGDFVVCLKPLDFEQEVSFRLLEWLELQYILGADKVQVYVYRLHPRMCKILEHYAGLGRVELRNYTLPGGIANWNSYVPLWQKRRYEMAVYNDCFYRHLQSHRFVVNLDIDEAIVPVVRDSWLELLTDYPHPVSASLSVRNVYFFDSFGETEETSVPEHMHMLRHVVRSANFTPPGFAQKSFFSTELAELVSNHFALRAVRLDVRLLDGMDVRSARLHHYRNKCPPLMDKDCDENYTRFRERDTLLWKFKDRLVRTVRNKMQELGLD